MGMTVSQPRLTHEGALALVQAAIAKAEELDVPQCIAVTDEGGRLLAFVRMTGAKFLSIRTARRKAMTAASSRTETGGIPAEHAIELGLVTGGRLTNMKGGLPIVADGVVIGGIGVSSGTGEQDRQVAEAAVAAVSL
jgi:uncharacterized protein GlcG (DUF336 family)